MGKGRKQTTFNRSPWENVFFNCVGTYVEIINLELENIYPKEPLSNHIEITGGYAFKSSEYKNKGIPVIRISDFTNERIVLDDVVYYDESSELVKYELKEGDIIIALTGGTIAKLAIVQNGIGKLYLNQRVGKFEIIKPDEFETEYVYWIARSVQLKIKNLAWGAAIPNVSPKQIEKIEFPIPPKNVQQKIIEFLNDLKQNKIAESRIYFNQDVEEKIISIQHNQVSCSFLLQEQKGQNVIINQLRQAFLREAMQGKLVPQDKNDEPATELLKRIKTEKEKLIVEGKLKKQKPLPEIKPEEIPYGIPESWVWCRLGEVCINIMDGTHYSPLNSEHGKFKYITAKNIKEYGIDLSNVTFITKEAHDEIYSKCNPEEGDILFIKDGATTGVVTINNLSEPFSLLSSVALLKIPTVILNKFLMYVMRGPNYYNATRKDMSGVAITRVTLTKIENSIVPIPPLVEQQRIVTKLEQLMQLCSELEKNINQSKEETNLLLQTVLREALEVEPNEYNY